MADTSEHLGKGGLRLRPIAPADNAAVRQLIHTVMPEFGAVGPGFALSDPEVDAMAEAYAAPRSAYVVLVDGADEVVGGGGYAALAGGDPDVAELRKMYLYQAVRGQGLGARLLAHLVAAARADGFSRLYLETMSKMTAARGLYERFGFTPLPGPWGATGHGGCDVHYARSLRDEPSAARSTAASTRSEAAPTGESGSRGDVPDT